MTDEKQGPVPLDNQLCYTIYSTGMAIQRLYKPLLDELGLTYPQFLVLNVLWAEDSQTVGTIAEKLALESSTLTPLLKRLEAAGLVDRRPCHGLQIGSGEASRHQDSLRQGRRRLQHRSVEEVSHQRGHDGRTEGAGGMGDGGEVPPAGEPAE